MNASELGSDDWWILVQSMPHSEAIGLLSSYKVELLKATAGTPQYIKASSQLTKVNFEIKRRNLILNEGRWKNICRQILPPELFDQVQTAHALANWNDGP